MNPLIQCVRDVNHCSMESSSTCGSCTRMFSTSPASILADVSSNFLLYSSRCVTCHLSEISMPRLGAGHKITEVIAFNSVPRRSSVTRSRAIPSIVVHLPQVGLRHQWVPLAHPNALAGSATRNEFEFQLGVHCAEILTSNLTTDGLMNLVTVYRIFHRMDCDGAYRKGRKINVRFA